MLILGCLVLLTVTARCTAAPADTGTGASCSTPPTVQFGDHVGPIQPNYRSGFEIKYKCQSYFTLVGKDTVTCKDGVWDEPPVCLGTGASCSTPPTVQFGDHVGPIQPNYRSGFEIKYKCQSYFTLVGKETVTCKDGVWDEPPVCLEPCVAKEKDLRENNIEFRWIDSNKLYTMHGDLMEFMCTEGYEIAHRRFLRMKCNKGVIPYPKCIKIDISCPPPPRIDNGLLITNPKAEYASGDKVHYSCNIGYNLKKKRNEATCEETRWKSIPVCRRTGASCSAPPTVQFGNYLGPNQPNYRSGYQIEYKCPSYYTLVGNRKVTCEDGEWDEPPVCLVPCRISLEELDAMNVRLKSQDSVNKVIQNGEEVDIECKAGSESPVTGISLKGDCNDGRMKYSRCFEGSFCRIDQDKMNGRNVELDLIRNDEGYYGDGEDVHFICRYGFRSMTELLTGRCVNKDLAYPRCIPESSCQIDQVILEQSNLGLDPKYNPKDYYEDGEEVRFSCKSGFIRTTPSLRRKCANKILPYPSCIHVESSA